MSKPHPQETAAAAQNVPPSCISSTLPPNTEQCPTPVNYKLQQSERICVNEAFRLRRYDRTVRFEIARPEDQNVIHSFLLNEFGHREPLNRALALTTEDLDAPLNEILNVVLPQKMSILVVDRGYLCGVAINSIDKVNRETAKEPKIQEDYGKELDTETGVSSKLRRIYTILEEMDAFLPLFIPADCTKYLKVDILSVRLEYSGCCVGKQLMAESFRLGHSIKLDYCATTCTANASARIAESLGLKLVFEFEYKAYKYHGEPVFPDYHMHDGCTSAKLMVGNLNQVVRQL